MAWKTLSVLPLLFLAAAAAPSFDCQPTIDTGQTLSMPLDLTGRPNVPAGVAGSGFAPVPRADASGGCPGSAAATLQPTTLRNDSDDILHGLPAPDILRPVDEPKRAPVFQ